MQTPRREEQPAGTQRQKLLLVSSVNTFLYLIWFFLAILSLEFSHFYFHCPFALSLLPHSAQLRSTPFHVCVYLYLKSPVRVLSAHLLIVLVSTTVISSCIHAHLILVVYVMSHLYIKPVCISFFVRMLILSSCDLVKLVNCKKYTWDLFQFSLALFGFVCLIIFHV